MRKVEASSVGDDQVSRLKAYSQFVVAGSETPESYSRDQGQRSAKISFNAGQATQDIGFRSEMVLYFNALPARTLRLRVSDEKGLPSIAAFTIRDALGRLYPNGFVPIEGL